MWDGTQLGRVREECTQRRKDLETDLKAEELWFDSLDAQVNFNGHACEDIPRLLSALRETREKLQKIEDNPRVGSCIDCGGSIWYRESVITDDSGSYHPICRVAKQLAAAESELRQLRERCDYLLSVNLNPPFVLISPSQPTEKEG